MFAACFRNGRSWRFASVPGPARNARFGSIPAVWHRPIRTRSFKLFPLAQPAGRMRGQWRRAFPPCETGRGTGQPVEGARRAEVDTRLALAAVAWAFLGVSLLPHHHASHGPPPPLRSGEKQHPYSIPPPPIHHIAERLAALEGLDLARDAGGDGVGGRRSRNCAGSRRRRDGSTGGIRSARAHAKTSSDAPLRTPESSAARMSASTCSAPRPALIRTGPPSGPPCFSSANSAAFRMPR